MSLKNALVRLVSGCWYWLMPYRRTKALRRLGGAFRSAWVATDFRKCGKQVFFDRIGELRGSEYISVGDRTCFAEGIVLLAWDRYEAEQFHPEINIGNDCSFGAWNHITAIDRITVGDGSLTGKWVTITDNAHGEMTFDALQLPPTQRKPHSKGPVTIGRNVWIGDKATILPGVTIGDGAIIAANAVVTRDIPAYSVAAGVPARVMKTIEKNGESH